MKVLGSTKIRTTAYHPIANGMIERFHRQLKAAIKCQPQPDRWVDALPWVLLGIRSALKEDLQCTTAELVYGMTLRLPGEFVHPLPPDSSTDPANFVGRLKATMSQLRPTQVREQPQLATHLPAALSTCTHVFVRRDAVKRPLQPPYDGPYRVLDRQAKYYTLEMRGKKDTVSVDRLKPAHQDPTPTHEPSTTFQPAESSTTTQPTTNVPPRTQTPSTTTQPTVNVPSRTQTPSTATCNSPRTTRSGRQVHWPRHLDSYIR